MEGVLKPGAMPLSVVARVTTWPLIGLLALPVIGWAAGGGVWHWLTVMVFAAVSLIDPFVGPDNINHRPEDETALEKSLFYRVMLWALVPAQWAVAVFCYWLFTQGDLTGVEQAGVLLSSAIAVGFGATAAHELAHHGQRFDRLDGRSCCSRPSTCAISRSTTTTATTIGSPRPKTPAPPGTATGSAPSSCAASCSRRSWAGRSRRPACAAWANRRGPCTTACCG